MALMFDNALAYNRKGSFHNRYAARVSHADRKPQNAIQNSSLQFQTFFARKAEELLLVRLHAHNYCCGKRRLLSGMSYRCRAATCFIQVPLVQFLSFLLNTMLLAVWLLLLAIHAPRG